MRRLPVLLVLAPVLLAGGCSADESSAAAAKPAVCDSFAAVQTTLGHIRDVNVSENGLTALRPYVAQLRGELNQLYQDAQAQFATQAQQLRASVEELGTNVRAAQGSVDVASLASVRTAVGAVRASAQDLQAAISSSC